MRIAIAVLLSALAIGQVAAEPKPATAPCRWYVRVFVSPTFVDDQTRDLDDAQQFEKKSDAQARAKAIGADGYFTSQSKKGQVAPELAPDTYYPPTSIRSLVIFSTCYK